MAAVAVVAAKALSFTDAPVVDLKGGRVVRVPTCHYYNSATFTVRVVRRR